MKNNLVVNIDNFLKYGLIIVGQEKKGEPIMIFFNAFKTELQDVKHLTRYNDLFFRSGLSKTDYQVFLFIAQSLDYDDMYFCKVSFIEIENKIGINKTCFSRSLKKLVHYGFLSKDNKSYHVSFSYDVAGRIIDLGL